jgi:hypothetical protein
MDERQYSLIFTARRVPQPREQELGTLIFDHPR